VAGLGIPLMSACGTVGSSMHFGAKTPVTHGPLVAAAQVPVGGGKILADKQIVVTQPRKGDFKAFSAVCTHMQCLVTTVRDGVIVCPCHGSKFAIADGAVTAGPAKSPLPEKSVSVEGDSIVLA